jgi:hypothetical protein
MSAADIFERDALPDARMSYAAIHRRAARNHG